MFRSFIPYCLMMLCTLAGCGDSVELAPLSGKVFYEGQPLPQGIVMLQPDKGQPSEGRIQADGSFVMKHFELGLGATVGRNRVTVTSFDSTHPATTAHGGDEPAQGRSLIPQRYGNYATSGLEVVVRSDENEPFVIQLQD